MVAPPRFFILTAKRNLFITTNGRDRDISVREHCTHIESRGENGDVRIYLMRTGALNAAASDATVSPYMLTTLISTAPSCGVE